MDCCLIYQGAMYLVGMGYVKSAPNGVVYEHRVLWDFQLKIKSPLNIRVSFHSFIVNEFLLTPGRVQNKRFTK